MPSSAEKLRIKRVKTSQKAAKTLKKAIASAVAIQATGEERTLEVARTLTRRQLKHVLAQPMRFEREFPGMGRLAQEVLIEKSLELDKE